jgi:hypothetical protein
LPDLVLPYNLQGRQLTFPIIDGTTGGPFDLTGDTVTLRIDSTDYVTNLLTKTLTVTTPTSGIATWTPISTDWTNFTNINQAYYGQITITAAGVNIPGLQFDIQLKRTLI